MTDFPEGAPDTTFAWAYADAVETVAERERAALRKLEEAIAADPEAHYYDPFPSGGCRPTHEKLYEGTGVGHLYGIPGCEAFAGELRDWEIVPGSKKPTPLETPQSVLGARA